MKKKTIVLLSHVVFDDSPYCRFVHEHAKALKNLGYNVIVFAVLNWFPFASIIKKDRKKHYIEKKGIQVIDGITIIYKKAISISNFLEDSKINWNGISYYLAVRKKIKKIQKEEEIFFIDAHIFKVEGYVASLLHRKMKLKAIVTCHGSSLNRTTKYKNAKYIINKISNNVNYMICVSNKLEKQLKQYNVHNTRVIYNGINIYNKNRVESERNINILTVGHLIEQKNIELVIKAFDIISKNYNMEKLVIIGNGNDEKKLKCLVNRLGIESKVSFEGKKSNEEVQNLMQKSRIFLLPSINEGFGIVYLEAMNNGCITIGTKNEGIDGFIKDGENGFLVEPNIDEIVKKIQYILEHEEKMSKIMENGIRDTEQLSWEYNAKEYIKIFNEEEDSKCQMM